MNVKPAVLVVGGTFDAEDCFGAWNLYKAIELQSPGASNKITMGPWYHGGWHRAEGSHLGDVRFGARTSDFYQQEIEIPFFEHHLRNTGSDSAIAEATVFFTGEDKWRRFSAWPPPHMEPTSLFLKNEGQLGFTKPSTAGSSEYLSDPFSPVPFSSDIPLYRGREYMIADQRFAARRPDVLVFSTDTLQDDLTLGGPLEAELYVKVPHGDADYYRLVPPAAGAGVFDVYFDTFGREFVELATARAR